MSRGSRCGASAGEPLAPPFCLSVRLFVGDDGGYTTLAVAVALLVSLTLVFSAASAQWVAARSADVQEVADATAMAGANGVAAFSTVAQVIDACVLSLGLAGTLVAGAGLLMMVIPGGQGVGAKALEVGKRVLDGRRSFARSSARGLERLERALPAIIALNSASCVAANSQGGIEYFGVAVPFPQQSESDYSFLDDGVDADEMSENAEELAEEAKKKEDADRKAHEARERAWQADCVDAPHCMRSRAESLAGLHGAYNPHYDSPSGWRFEFARIRACNYYATRAQQEVPAGSSVDELTRSAAREAFYRYAYVTISSGRCVETEDEVYLDLPELPHTSDMVRATSLYTDARWPCTVEEGRFTLHASRACPAAAGTGAGTCSLAELESGAVRRCDACHMDVGVMGSVASASTYIDNGFEHYWRILVAESRAYQAAKEESREAERKMQETSERGADLFQRAIDALSVDRPKLRPAGAWGCVAVVCRKEGVSVPTELSSSFTSGADLPPGIALAAATLAPDDDTDGNTVLARVLDGLGDQRGFVLDLLGNVCELWGRLLVSYGSAYESVSGITDSLLGGVGSLFGERVASWLRDKISSIVRAAGFEPADMRLRKPVLVHSQQVLDKAGLNSLGAARTVIAELPQSIEEIRAVNWERVLGELGMEKLTIAELPIPGLEGVSIPLTIDIAEMLGKL